MTLVLSFASDLCNNNDNLLIVGSNYYIDSKSHEYSFSIGSIQAWSFTQTIFSLNNKSSYLSFCLLEY